MLKSIRNSLILTSLLYVGMGVVLMIFPGTSLSLACILIGAVTLIYGLVRIVSYVRGGETAAKFDLVAGILLALLGVFLLLCPQLLVSLIPIALGVYIIVDSVTAMKKAMDLKALGFERWWISLLAAVLLAVCGVVMILQPFSVASALVVFIGIGFLFDGVFTLVNTLIYERLFRG